MALVKEVATNQSSNHRPCHQFNQKQDRLGVKLLDNLEELDVNQLQDRAMCMGIATQRNVKGWILELGYHLMRIFLSNPQ